MSLENKVNQTFLQRIRNSATRFLGKTILLTSLLGFDYGGCGGSEKEDECQTAADCPPPLGCVYGDGIYECGGCKYDSNCLPNQKCLNGACVDKKNFVIEGTIYDWVTEQPLSGVSVSIKDLGSDTTDLNGGYKLGILGIEGTYLLELKREGYFDKKINISLPPEKTYDTELLPSQQMSSLKLTVKKENGEIDGVYSLQICSSYWDCRNERINPSQIKLVFSNECYLKITPPSSTFEKENSFLAYAFSCQGASCSGGLNIQKIKFVINSNLVDAKYDYHPFAFYLITNTEFCNTENLSFSLEGEHYMTTKGLKDVNLEF